MIKRYNEFLKESNSDGKSLLFDRISKFGYFFVDNFRKPIDDILRSMAISKDCNDEYQVPLELLFKTGKYPMIKNINGKFIDDRFNSISLVVGEDGKWHPVNKLNTNYSDIADLLSDILDKSGFTNSLLKLNDTELKDALIRYRNKYNLKEEMDKLCIDIKSYIQYNRRFSDIGEINENKVSDFLSKNGCEILYQGGDGDVVDMLYGCDLIVSKNDKIFLVQVKSKISTAKESVNNYKYSNIDWFCAPTYNGIIIFTRKSPEGKILN